MDGHLIMANIPWMDLMLQWLSAPEAGWLLSGFFLLIICWKSYRHQQILQQHQYERNALHQQWQRDKDALHQADLNLDQLQIDIRTQERCLVSTQTQLKYFQAVQQELALLKQTHQQVCDEKNAPHTQLQLEQTKAQSALTAASEKLAFLEQSQRQHRAQFEQLAEQILSKKTAQTQAQHQNALDHLLPAAPAT